VFAARPLATISGAASVCVNAMARYAVQRQTGVVYTWTVSGGSIVSASDADTLLVQWNAAGNGRIVVRLSNGSCEASDTLDVNISSSLHPRISAAGPLSRCAGDTLLLRADTGYQQYEWRDAAGALLGTGQDLAVLASGSYTVSVRDASGCSGSSDTVAVRFNPLPAPIVLGPAAICPGDTALLDAGAGFAIYDWRSASGAAHGTARYLNVTSAGLYHVIVTDANGCSGASADHAVMVYPAPVKPVITRSGDTLTSTVAATYAWYVDGVKQGVTTQSVVTRSAGSYVVRITDANGCRAESDPIDMAKTVSIQTTIALPSVQAAPGERVIVPLRLASQNNIAALSRKDYAAELRFNKSLLYPEGATPIGSIQGAERVIPFSGVFSDTQTPLTELTFTAMLGDSERTALRLVNFAWGDSNATAVTTDGEFLLTICREGGARLFDGGARFGVTAHPNPFNASTVIEYTTISSDPVALFVVDALGRRVATLAEGTVAPGKHRTVFDASGLASGMYRVLLVGDGMAASVVLMMAK
jgi:hypothetical protein